MNKEWKYIKDDGCYVLYINNEDVLSFISDNVINTRFHYTSDLLHIDYDYIDEYEFFDNIEEVKNTFEKMIIDYLASNII